MICCLSVQRWNSIILLYRKLDRFYSMIESTSDFFFRPFSMMTALLSENSGDGNEVNSV